MIALQDSRSKLFYDRERGGFSQPDIAKATRMTTASEAAFIKAHFARPEFIQSIETEEVAKPVTNKHTDGSVKPVKVGQWKDGSREYHFGDWRINCYYYDQHRDAHPYIKATTPRRVPMWHAHNDATKESKMFQSGSMRIAIRQLIKHERNRTAV